MEKLAYSASEFGELTGLGRNSVYAAIRSGQLPALRVGRRLIIPSGAVNDLLRGRLKLPGALDRAEAPMVGGRS